MKRLLALPLLFLLLTGSAQHIDVSFGQSSLMTTERYSERANTISAGINYPMPESWQGFHIAAKIYVAQGQTSTGAIRVQTTFQQPAILDAEITHTQKTGLLGFTIANKKEERKPYPSFGIMLGYSLFEMRDKITEERFRSNDYIWDGTFDPETNEHLFKRGSFTFSAQLRYHLPLTDFIDSHAGVFVLMGALDQAPSINAGIELGGSVNLGALL